MHTRTGIWLFGPILMILAGCSQGPSLRDLAKQDPAMAVLQRQLTAMADLGDAWSLPRQNGEWRMLPAGTRAWRISAWSGHNFSRHEWPTKGKARVYEYTDRPEVVFARESELIGKGFIVSVEPFIPVWPLTEQLQVPSQLVNLTIAQRAEWYFTGRMGPLLDRFSRADTHWSLQSALVDLATEATLANLLGTDSFEFKDYRRNRETMAMIATGLEELLAYAGGLNIDGSSGGTTDPWPGLLAAWKRDFNTTYTQRFSSPQYKVLVDDLVSRAQVLSFVQLSRHSEVLGGWTSDKLGTVLAALVQVPEDVSPATLKIALEGISP